MDEHNDALNALSSGHDSDDSTTTTPMTTAATPAATPRGFRYMLHIAYIGSNFVGWQRQPEPSKSGRGSVQELVEDTVTTLLNADKRVNVTSVSRTDAGTHALYQYGSIRIPSELPVTLEVFCAQLNAALPDSVVVHSVTAMDALARVSRIRSRYKKYIYYIQQGKRPDLAQGRYSWFIGKKLDPQRLRDALAFVVGTHDFRTLSQGLQKAEFADRTTIRTLLSATVHVRSSVQFSLDPSVCGTGALVDDEPAFIARAQSAAASNNNASNNSSSAAAIDPIDQTKRNTIILPGTTPVYYICIELIANGFLRHMVRRIVGTLRPIGEGTFAPRRMQQVLDGDVEPGPSAPAKGLWLHHTWLTQAEWDADQVQAQAPSA